MALLQRRKMLFLLGELVPVLGVDLGDRIAVPHHFAARGAGDGDRFKPDRGLELGVFLAGVAQHGGWYVDAHNVAMRMICGDQERWLVRIDARQ